MDTKERNKIKNQFLNQKDKNILIYGTKAYAKSLITALGEFSIIGVLDQYQVEGDLLGVPILEWDEVTAKMADLLIIGANEKYYDEIYRRIIYKCTYLNICIFGYNGQNLTEKYMMRNYPPETALYFRKNEEELRILIDSHDAISFDLFDTLIMRKVLEPTDIFRIVEKRLKTKGYAVPGFHKKRRTAEINSNGGDLETIYKNLGHLFGVEDEVLYRIMEEEIACEKENLILRKKMAEMFAYALAKGKQVNIISDMYFPADILEDILAGLGICGFNKIFVSCEYGKSKENGLFKEYKKEINGLKYLHIGDNRRADIIAAENCGIKAYEIKSGYEMLKITSMRSCLVDTVSEMDRKIMGELVSLIFNNPFSLYDTAGILHIKDCKTFAYMFFVPLIVVYMQKIEEMRNKNDYDGILFTSRDGYLLKKIYDANCREMKGNSLQSYYLLVSRLLSHKATIFDEKDVINFIKETGNELDSSRFDEIIQEGEKTRQNYFEYLEKSNIDISKKYLVCDLISQGTVLKGLNQLFERPQQGLFMAWSYCNPELPVELVYGSEEWQEARFTTCVLEKILTSLEPSIDDMGIAGEPVYAVEDREEDELVLVEKIHKEIINGTNNLYRLSGVNGQVSKKLAQTLFYLIDDIILCEELKVFNDFKVVDDVSKTQIRFKNRVICGDR